MKSVSIYTEEMDDLEAGVQELSEKLQAKLKLLKNSCGLLFCDKDTDLEELMPYLKKTFAFPIMGCTSLAMLTREEGYRVSGLAMLVLTADDCEFSLAITETLSDENREQQIKEVYKQATSQLGEKEKVIIMYASKPIRTGGDEYVTLLDKVSCGVPVFGALASDTFSFSDYKVFLNDRIEHMGMVILLISGNINPIYRMEYSLDHMAEFSAIITEAQGCKIVSLDNMPFTEALKKAGLESQMENTEIVIMEFIGTPFMVDEKMEDGITISKMRNLTSLDYEKGTGYFLGNMQQGAMLRIGLMKKEDVQLSVKEAFSKLLEEIAASEHDYHTLLCSSCGSRYLILATEPDAEAKAFQGVLPEDMSLTGFYSFGEICPFKGDNGKLYNSFNNDTFTIMAL